MTRRPGPPQPPRLARLLLRLGLSPEAAEIVTGDLDETFEADAGRFGTAVARRRYWQMSFRSVLSRWRPALRPDDPSPRRGGANALMRDVRLGARQFSHRPGFAFAVAGTLALGIAAATTVFGLANALMLRPLAYHQPDRVVFLLGWNTEEDRMAFAMRYIDATALASGMTTLESAAVYRGWNANLSQAGVPERLQAYAVSPNTFDVLGVPAAIGRTLRADDARGDGRVAVLSHGLWTRRFGGEAIVGREIVLDGAAYTVVGVMPASFEFPIFNFKGDLWTPLQADPGWTPAERVGSPSVVAVARLADEVTVESAQTEAAGFMSQLARAFPDANGSRGVRVMPMAQLGNDQASPVFAVLGVTAVLVLLIACANAAGLQLARGLARGREVAVRAALGASRWRLMRQFLIESLWLALAGGLAGAGLAWFALEGLRGAMPDYLARVLPGSDAVRVDLTSLGFACVASMATVLLFGAMPAWRASSPAAADALRTAGRASTTPQRSWLRSGLVVGEVAVAVTLVVMTGLLARSARLLADADPGFDKARLLAFSIAPPPARYPTAADVSGFYSRLHNRLQAVPGVRAVAAVNSLPFSTSNNTATVTLPGDETPRQSDYRVVTPGYLSTMGIPLVEGRAFFESDRTPGAVNPPDATHTPRPIVALANQAFVRRFFPDTPALGREVLIGATPARIVGVTADTRHWTLSDSVNPAVYVPMDADPQTRRTLVVRTDGDPVGLIGSVRAASVEIDPQLALFDVATMDEMVGNSFIGQRIAARVLIAFGIGALVLTCSGLYALLAVVVASRTKEIGLRVALGASPSAVVSTVLRRAMALCGAGLVLGVAVAILAGRGLASMLYGVGPLDPASYLGAAALLGLVTLGASWLPVHRALRVDPMIALRYD